MPDLPRIAECASQEDAFMHEATTKAETEIEIIEFVQVTASAIEPFPQGRRRHIDLDERRQARKFRQPLSHRKSFPALQRRRTDEAHGFHVKGTWHGKPHAEQASAAAQL